MPDSEKVKDDFGALLCMLCIPPRERAGGGGVVIFEHPSVGKPYLEPLRIEIEYVFCEGAS